MADFSGIINRFRATRKWTEKLCENLETEDMVVQCAPFVSPAKWHLAHTTWFFETMVLAEYLSDYSVVHPQYNLLFNSYYKGAGEHWRRDFRGGLSRPTVARIIEYRQAVNERLTEHWPELMARPERREILRRIETGIHHEQQHQELLLMDIKYNFFVNPLKPEFFRRDSSAESLAKSENQWLAMEAGVRGVGTDEGDETYCFDNETPRHSVFLDRFAVSGRRVTNGEYLRFVEDGGYQNFRLWHADGWDRVCQEKWRAPLYWSQVEGEWRQFTLYGERPLELHEPVCHLSFFEASAYAHWSGRRLPTEGEWETAATELEIPEDSCFLTEGEFHPRSARAGHDFFGGLWEWTGSAYLSYPGYRPPAGLLGEYNGKFMCGQMVLKGGSFATPRSHFRKTYRNFFYPHERWMFSGLRLAKDL